MPTSDDLELIGVHVAYEWRMLQHAAKLYQSLATTEAAKEYRYVALESFAVHARNLIEFLHFNPDGQYVRAIDYFQQPEQWTRARPALGEGKKLLNMANKQIQHLSYERLRVKPAEEVRDLIGAMQYISEVMQKLTDLAQECGQHRLLIVMAQCGFTPESAIQRQSTDHTSIKPTLTARTSTNVEQPVIRL